jgi:chorismate mutase/prephenate dehydratase
MRKPAGVGKPGSSSRSRPKAGARRVSGASGGGGVPSAADLGSLRTRIDDLDRRLVELLNSRAGLVVEVGKYKQAHGIPIYAPHREAEVLMRVLGHNAGPLQNRTIEGIYRELMSGSFALEKPLSIGYLGPPGSYSHMAAVRHFGSSVSFEDLHAVDGVFTEVQRGHVDYGLVPIENSLHGGVIDSMDSFVRTGGPASGLQVYAEVQMEVHHNLLANCAPAKVRTIYSKPEVFSQCRNWLATQYPKAELVAVASSSRAVQMVRDESEKHPKTTTSAAIGSTLSGELYDVRVLFEKIEDSPDNITRFFVISRHAAQRAGDDPGNKTSIMFTTLNKPGALVGVLQEFQRAKVNLTHIDKRPSGRQNWTYTFFIDAEGHSSDAPVARAIAKARGHCKELAVLGSYPRSKRILG